MIVVGGDLESTGLEVGDHRIIEIHISTWDLASRLKLDAQTWRIHPQRSIAAAAQAVHGISITDLEGCPHWNLVAGDIRERFEHADLVIGHNWNGFDKPFIDYEMERVGLPALTKPTFDTCTEARWATPTGAIPNLGDLCFACEVPYDRALAHAADYDVNVMMACFFKGFDWGWFKIAGVS